MTTLSESSTSDLHNHMTDWRGEGERGRERVKGGGRVLERGRGRKRGRREGVEERMRGRGGEGKGE